MQVELYCEIQLFDMDQLVYTISSEGKKTLIAKLPLSEVPKAMPVYCFANNATVVHLFGQPESVIEELKEKILLEQKEQYSKMDIVVKVNE